MFLVWRPWCWIAVGRFICVQAGICFFNVSKFDAVGVRYDFSLSCVISLELLHFLGCYLCDLSAIIINIWWYHIFSNSFIFRQLHKPFPLFTSNDLLNLLICPLLFQTLILLFLLFISIMTKFICINILFWHYILNTWIELFVMF